MKSPEAERVSLCVYSPRSEREAQPVVVAPLPGHPDPAWATPHGRQGAFDEIHGNFDIQWESDVPKNPISGSHLSPTTCSSICAFVIYSTWWKAHSHRRQVAVY